MDRLESMSILLAVVEAGSLSAAGRQAGMPLATVSRKISELETHLGTRLLNRSTRQLSLTEAGRSYVEACKRIMEQIAEAERAASGEYSHPRGELVITAPIVFGRLHVLPVVLAFLKTYPDIDIRLVLTDRLAHLIEDHIDVAVRIGALPDSSLLARKVGTIHRITCASPAYLAEHGIPQAPGDLSGHDCITFGAMDSGSAWTYPAGKSELVVAVHSRLTVNTAEAAIDATLAGVGITRVLSYQAADAMRAGTLTRILRDFEPPASPVSLIHAGQGLLPLKLRAFLDFAAPQLRDRLTIALG
jgi:DNA-binding transcriptional LysR family regulator